MQNIFLTPIFCIVNEKPRIVLTTNLVVPDKYSCANASSYLGNTPTVWPSGRNSICTTSQQSKDTVNKTLILRL